MCPRPYLLSALHLVSIFPGTIQLQLSLTALGFNFFFLLGMLGFPFFAFKLSSILETFYIAFLHDWNWVKESIWNYRSPNSLAWYKRPSMTWLW
jgi:hypothetical protein